MKLSAVLFALAGCASEPAAPFAVTEHLAMPADLQISGDQVYSIQYDGSIVATSTVDHGVTTIVPAIRPIAANEISIDLDAYGIAVTADALYWTEQVNGMPAVHRADLDGSHATVLATGFAPHHALIAIEGGACWSSEVAIACAHGTVVTTLATGLAEPHAMTTDGTMLYFAEPSSLNRLGGVRVQGDGGLYAVPLAGGAVQTLAIGLDDPRSLVLVGEKLVWVDGGSQICSSNLCTPNHDASLHTFDLAVPDAGARVISGAYSSVDAGLAVEGETVYFVAEARLRSRSLTGIQEPGGEVLVSHAAVGCTALAVADSLLYCADADQITAIGI